MVLNIERDHSRFRQIIRGKIKQDLRRYITRGEVIGKTGRELVSIPIPQIELPRFRHGTNQGGVGQGEGEAGDPLDPNDGEGTGGAGDQPGAHLLEVEVSLDELAAILGEELRLPNIEPRGKAQLRQDKDRYTSIRPTGPESLRHFSRTYKKALQRHIASGTYDPAAPLIVFQREDRRYRARKVIEEPQANAVIIYMMDVSGSMGDEQKEIVRIESFWIDTWLRSQYDGIETRYIVHDAAAKEVDAHTFYHLHESGGTKISSAYELCSRMIQSDYSPQDWNTYLFHFSDGDNWGSGDTELCVSLLGEQLLPGANLFCYGQVESPYGSGQFLKDLHEHFSDDPRIVTSHIPDKEGIYDSIREFLGTGR